MKIKFILVQVSLLSLLVSMLIFLLKQVMFESIYEENNSRLPIDSPIKRESRLIHTGNVKTVESSHVVYVDWPYDSDNLSYLNYKALESLLACCYHEDMKMIVMIIAKNTGHNYKIRNLLGKTTFMKYSKKGYNIQTEIYSSVTSLFTKEQWHIGPDKNYLGKDYFNKQLNLCCRNQESTKTNEVKVLPIHLLFYARIARLYSRGGEFYDLSWFHQKSISAYRSLFGISQGVAILNFCYSVLNSTTEIIHTMNSNNIDCASSTIMIFLKPNSTVLRYMLEEYNDSTSILIECITNSSSFKQVECIKEAFDRSFKKANVINQLNHSSINSVASYQERTSLGTDVSLVSHEDASYLTTESVYWLGPAAISGQWEHPEKNSFLGRRIDKNNEIISNFTKLSFLKLGYSFAKVPSCQYYALLHPQPDRYSRQANVSCTLSFIIPGFMKAGSTYLFDLLGKHPQVVLALRGFAFKETGCYYPEQIASGKSFERMNCFPFIEPHDEIIYGDGTVFYVHKYESARILKRDNPNLKSILVLRDPLERSKSHHRYSYSNLQPAGLGDMNMAVNEAICSGTRLNKLYYLAKRALVEARAGNFRGPVMLQFIDVTSKFHKPSMMKNSTYEKIANLIFSSLYFHTIYIWDSIIGRDNLMVIEAERISMYRTQKALSKKASLPQRTLLKYTGYNMTKTMEEEIEPVYRFIGLVPPKKLPGLFGHGSNANIPEKHKLNEESKYKLLEFFLPFNELLARYLQARSGNSLSQSTERFF